MENKDEKETPPPIIDQLKEYAETQIKLAKLEAIDKSATFLASFVTDMIIACVFLLTFLFLSFAAGFLLSTSVFHSYAAGFGCMAGIYFVIAVLIILLKDKIQVPITNLFIKKFFE
ncbi:MAG: phage holin family protein [Sphingobacteriales bacterium]